jgi:hypothetical protein
MAALVIKDVNSIATPGDTALPLESMPHARNPDLLGKSLRNLLLFIRVYGHVAKLHSVSSSCDA